MKKLFFFFVITIFSFNVYASNVQICDAYNVFEEYRAKVTIEYYPDLDHYKISYKDVIFYFGERSKSDPTSYNAKHERYSGVLYSGGWYTPRHKISDTEERHHIRVTKDGRKYNLDFKNCEYVK